VQGWVGIGVLKKNPLWISEKKRHFYVFEVKEQACVQEFENQ
jgi:hypothetical protein